MPGPFEGLRVIDLTTVIVGPYTSQFLGDMGADVIKIESPEGDMSRLTGPSRNPGMTSHWMQTNRNKRSLALDLKTPEGAEAMRRLLGTADVFVHNMRPEPLDRLGLAYAQVKELRPDIVFCNIWGFGRQGRYAGRAAFDDVIQGASGLVALEAFGGKPAKYMPMLIADKTTALFAAYGIACALYHRKATGEGQEVEVPMFESMVSFTMLEHLWGASFSPPLARVGSERHATPERWPYATADGYICVLPSSDKHWRAVFETAGRPELMDDPRFASRRARSGHRKEIMGILEGILAERPTAFWAEALASAGVPCMPISSLEDVVADPHLADVGFWHEAEHPTEGPIRLMKPPIGLSATPPGIRRLPARFGEHTRELLSELGYDAGEIDALVSSGAARAE
jgi:crotonobetainyl-CoA:carnitine CoA-transferase CaiB-like acyl-CoA transferase